MLLSLLRLIWPSKCCHRSDNNLYSHTTHIKLYLRGLMEIKYPIIPLALLDIVQLIDWPDDDFSQHCQTNLEEHPVVWWECASTTGLLDLASFPVIQRGNQCLRYESIFSPVEANMHRFTQWEISHPFRPEWEWWVSTAAGWDKTDAGAPTWRRWAGRSGNIWGGIYRSTTMRENPTFN